MLNRIILLLAFVCVITLGTPFSATAQGSTSYCAASYNSANYERIGKVTIGTRSNPSTGTSPYESFLNVVFPLTSSNQVTLTPQFPYASYPEYWAVYIDWDKNGNFTGPGEVVWSSTSATSQPVTFTLTPPSSALGQTRMRIRIGYGAVSNVAPCGTFSFGQVEDYTVSVQSPPPTTTPVGTIPATPTVPLQPTTAPTVPPTPTLLPPTVTPTITPTPTGSSDSGKVDTSFGNQGKITISDPTVSSIKTLSPEAGGKIMLGGTSYVGSTTCGRVIRLTNSGTFDTSFSSTGSLPCQGDMTGASVGFIQKQPDGGYLITGNSLARYSNSGQKDLQFVSTGWEDSANQLGRTFPIVMPDTSIFFGSLTYRATSFGSAYFPALAKLKNNGAIDTSFGTNGRITTTAGYPPHIGVAWVKSTFRQTVNQETRLLVVGHTLPISGIIPQDSIAFARFKSDGLTDQSFGIGGMVTFQIQVGPAGNVSVLGAVLQSTGKVIVAVKKGDSLLLFRFNIDGTLDTTFGVSGWIEYPLLGRAAYVPATGPVTDRIVVAFSDYTYPNSAGSILIRLTKDGLPDTTFSGGTVLASDIIVTTSPAISLDESTVTIGGMVAPNQPFGIARVIRYKM